MMGEKVFEPGAVTYEGDLASKYPMTRMVSAETADTWSEVLRPFLTVFYRPTVFDLGCGTGRFSTLIADVERLLWKTRNEYKRKVEDQGFYHIGGKN